MARHNPCTFSVSRLRMRLSSVRFLPTVWVVKPSHDFPPSLPRTSCGVLHVCPTLLIPQVPPVQRSFVCQFQRNRDLLRHRQRSRWVFPVVLPSQMSLKDDVKTAGCHVLKLERPSLHDAALASMLANFENARDSMNDLRYLGPACPDSAVSLSAAF